MMRQIVKIFVFFGIFLWAIRPSFAADPIASIDTTLTDIWEYNAKSIFNFQNSFSKILFNDNQGQSQNPDLVQNPITLSNIEEINKIIATNKQYLEQLSRRPITKDLTSDSKTPKLSEKLDQTKISAANLYSGIQNLKGRYLILSNKWAGLTEDEIKSELTTLSSIFTQDTTQKGSSILATANWLKTSWDSPIMVDIMDETQTTQSQIENLLNDITTSGKVNNTLVLDSALNHINKLDQLIGSSLALATDPSLFGFIRKTSDQISLFDKQSTEATQIMTELNDNPSTDQTTAIDRLQNEIIRSNLLPNASLFLSSTTGPQLTTNRVLGLLALVDSNKLLLAGKTGQIIKNIWIEDGGVVFLIMVSNPSRIQIQTANVKYVLPAELKPEQVLNHDPHLIITTDPTENAVVASGDILLAPLETRILTVEVENIWNFNPSETENLKSQVNLLTMSLKNTTGYAKAESLEKDILTGLEKLLQKYQQSITPESRIVSFREASLTLNEIEHKISSLKSLFLESKSNGNILGISTEAQAFSLRGIISLIVVSFAFIMLYVNALKSQSGSRKGNLNKANRGTPPHSTEKRTTIQYRFRETSRPRLNRFSKMIVLVLISGGLGSFGTSLAIKSLRTVSDRKAQAGTGTQVLGATTQVAQKKFPYEAKLLPPKTGSIPVRSAPSITSPQIRSLNESQTISVFKKTDNWVMIINQSDNPQNTGWWVNESFLE